SPNSRWENLEQYIPASEDEWRKAREQHRFTTPDDISIWISNLILDQSLPENLRRFINVAIFCIEKEKDEDQAHCNYEARAGTKCAGRSVRNYAVLIRGVISLMDQVFPSLRHRAFEAVLLYIPLDLVSLSYYKKEPERFKSCFRQIEIIPEEHASQALYLPFIIASRYPEYKYETICKALGTTTLDKSEYLKFVSVRKNSKPMPYILLLHNESHATNNLYDPIRDIWTKKDGNDPVTTEQGASVGVFDIDQNGYKPAASME
ncbi:hypothetical protein FCULG_00012829, partial [Fusarium culmorum]